jgi:hypothetical protein
LNALFITFQESSIESVLSSTNQQKLEDQVSTLKENEVCLSLFAFLFSTIEYCMCYTGASVRLDIID